MTSRWLHAILPVARWIQRLGSTVQWTARSCDPRPIEQSIIHRFEDHVRRDGRRSAIEFQGSSLSYHELNCRANRVARAILARRGAGPEPIALVFETGLDVIVSMLGVLKAGKFYVPLDISWPAARFALVLQDSQAELIVSSCQQVYASATNAAWLAQVSDRRNVLWTDSLDHAALGDNVGIESRAGYLAYVLYTSGSEGRPKGVVQNHRYVLNLVHNYTVTGAMNERDRFSLLSSAAFGGAVRDIFCALLNGATLLPADVKQVGPHLLGQWLQENRVSVMFVVATLFRELVVNLHGRGTFPTLRLVEIGSETVYRKDAELFQAHFHERCVLMVNLGGTEISPVRQLEIRHDTVLGERGTVPAGYEVEGTHVALWDDFEQEVAEGDVGEIVVCSRQLAVGYWRRADLTERAFVSRAGRRYFKCGDLGRFSSDDCLVHLGRKDNQVKIRGYRVETSEVEACLQDEEAIRAAIVVAGEPDAGATGDRRLVAYLVASAPGEMPAASYLRAALKTKIPAYMMPASYVWLDSLPLTATGKLDRRSLTAPDVVPLTSGQRLVPPRNATEQALVSIWSEVLDDQSVGIDDDFFELGGDSLRAIRIVARVSARLNMEVPLSAIFDSPTIRQLSEHSRSAAVPTRPPRRMPLRPVRNEQVPLSPTQQRFWFLEQLHGRTPEHNIVRAFELSGRLNLRSWRRAVAALVERHEALRARFESRNGEPWQVVARHVDTPLSVVDLSAEPHGDVDTRVLQVADCPLDVSRAPLMRLTLFRLAEDELILLVVIHHIISDDWSTQILLKEVSSLYASCLAGSAPTLDEVAVRYTDHAVWQANSFPDAARAEQLEYWKEQLTGAPALIELPLDRPRTIEPWRAGRVPVHLDGELSRDVIELCRRTGTTPFIALLAMYCAHLSRYGNQGGICVASPIANRKGQVAEDMVGAFADLLVLRTRPTKGSTFLEFLARIRQVALDAYVHSDVPINDVVARLNPTRFAGTNALFQVMFILQNVPLNALELPGMAVSAMPLARTTAGVTVDMTLSLREEASGFVGALEYNANLFDAATAQRTVIEFEALVQAATVDPGKSLTRLLQASA